MTATQSMAYWVARGYVGARCRLCNTHLEAGQQPNGIWCEASVLVQHTNPLGQIVYKATCGYSVQHGLCKRPHLYECGGCGWAININ